MAKKNLVPASQQQLDANAWLARINDLPDEQAQEEERSGVRAVADTAVQFGKGAVSGVRMMSDVFGADNAVSGGLRTVDDALNGLLSATAKQDQQQVAAILQEAEGKGWMEQIGLGLKAAGVAPGALLAQAAGTAIPTMAAALIPGALPARLAAGAMGAAQGVGTTKGSIYETVKNELLKSGATQEEAEARAVEAQSYGGDNSGQIALSGGLGILAGTIGMEKAIHGLRSGVTKAAPGLTGRMTMGGLVEAGPETLQGGQEKYATNTALANEGFQVDPMSGVAANATMEGVAGAGMGAAFGIPNPSVTPGAPAAQETPPVSPTLPADQLRATKIPENGPMTAAVNAGIESKAQEIESLAEKSARIRAAIEPIIQQRKEQNDAAELADLVESERRDKQVMLAQMDMERQKQAEIDAAFEAKPALEAQQRAATLDAPSAMQQAFQQASQADQVAAVPSPVTQAPEPRIVERTPDMKPMPLELAELQVEMDGGEVVRTQNRNGKYAYHVIKEQAKPKAAPVVEEKPDQANVIKNNLGKPFTNLFAANNAASKAGAGWSVVKVGKNAFEVHRNEQNTAQGTDTTPAKAPGEAPQAVAGDAAATGGVPAAGTGAVEGIWVDESMRSNLSALPVATVEQAQVAIDIAAKEQAAQKAYSAHRKEFLAQFTGSDLKQNEKFVIAAEHKFSAGRIRSLKGGKTVEVADRTDGSATRYMMGPSGDFIPVQVVELGSTATYQPNNTPTATAPASAPNGVTQQPAQPVTGQGAGATQPTQDAPTNQGATNGNESTQASQAAETLLTPKAEKPKKLTPNQRIAKNLKGRADYFATGNIVQGYSGHDRVISYKPPTGDGEGWNVTVQSVVKQDGKWVTDPKDNRTRTHSTMPGNADLARGPVERAAPTEQPTAPSAPVAPEAPISISYTENGKTLKLKDAKASLAAMDAKINTFKEIIKCLRG